MARSCGRGAARTLRRCRLHHPDKVRTTIGWPKRAASCGRIGECWPPELSSDRHAETFISLELTDAAEIIATLAHELVHATMESGVGHGPPFKRCALAIGLRGPMRATSAGPALGGCAVAEDRPVSGGIPYRHAEAEHAHAAVPVHGMWVHRAGVAPVARSGRAADLSH
jgi:SprT-like family